VDRVSKLDELGSAKPSDALGGINAERFDRRSGSLRADPQALPGQRHRFTDRLVRLNVLLVRQRLHDPIGVANREKPQVSAIHRYPLLRVQGES
jgi:hypothetical protein